MWEREGGALLAVLFKLLLRLSSAKKRWNKADEPWQLFCLFSKLQIYTAHSNSYMACPTGTIFESKGKFHFKGNV